MKYIITEDQLEKVKDKILKIDFYIFDNDWNILQKFLSKRGNPPYIITDDVDLSGNKEITTLGNLISVGGDLDLIRTPIQSLGNLTSVGGNLSLVETPLQSLGNLTSVGGSLNLRVTPIESLGNLTSIGGYLDLTSTPINSFGNLTSVGTDIHLEATPISKRYSKQEIKKMVKVGGKVYYK